MEETVRGTVTVCGHTVEYWYDVEDIKLSDELVESLKEEAESRAKAMINEGYNQGELNCLWQGEEEIRGWWVVSQ